MLHVLVSQNDKLNFAGMIYHLMSIVQPETNMNTNTDLYNITKYKKDYKFNNKKPKNVYTFFVKLFYKHLKKKYPEATQLEIRKIICVKFGKFDANIMEYMRLFKDNVNLIKRKKHIDNIKYGGDK